MMHEFRGVVKTLKGVSRMIDAWKEKVRQVETVAEELGAVRRECEMLRMSRGVVFVNGEENGPRTGEVVRIASPMEVDGFERVDSVEVKQPSGM